MAINTNSGVKSAATPSTSAMAASVASTNDLIELNIMKKDTADVVTTTPILKRKGGNSSKKLQFTTPEFSVTPIATEPGVKSCLIPSRKR